MNLRPFMQRLAWRDARATSRVAVLVALVFCFLGAWIVFGQAPRSKILVVNSDGGIEKYAAAQVAFRETIAQPVKELNLAGLGDAAAERAIRAEAPTAVYSIGAKAFMAASRAAKGKTIVMSSVINWQHIPAANAPGTHVIANELLSVSQLTLFHYFFPQVKRIGVLYSTTYNRQWMADAIAAGRDVGVEVIGVAVRTTAGARSELPKLMPKVDALWVTADPVVLADEPAVRALFAALQAAKKPVFTYTTAFTEFNPTLIVAPDVPTIGRQAAGLLMSLRPGARKEVQSPAGSEVTLNLRAVKEYGLRLNEEAMDSVNNLIR